MADSAVTELVKLLRKANHDLNIVEHSLDKEFRQNYPENVNPMKLVSRIKRIQADLLLLKEQSCELLAAKQDMIDKAKTVLVRNRSLLQSLQVSCSFPVPDSSACNQHQLRSQMGTQTRLSLPGLGKSVIDEWTNQLKSNKEEDDHKSDSENINQLIFSAIVQRPEEERQGHIMSLKP